MRRECWERFPRHRKITIPICITARPRVTHVLWSMPESLTSCLIWSQWQGKRSRHSGRMRNPQIYVSDEKSIGSEHFCHFFGTRPLSYLHQLIKFEKKTNKKNINTEIFIHLIVVIREMVAILSQYLTFRVVSLEVKFENLKCWLCAGNSIRFWHTIGCSCESFWDRKCLELRGARTPQYLKDIFVDRAIFSRAL